MPLQAYRAGAHPGAVLALPAPGALRRRGHLVGPHLSPRVPVHVHVEVDLCRVDFMKPSLAEIYK
jgi:hypothetical protein